VSLTESLSHVKQVIGSNYSDNIIGNDLPNILNGGLGSDNMQDGNGADIYIVEEDSGNKTIDNYANDLEEDLLVI
jgi:Ca2+-binding RTX toxin-like protein